MIVLCCDICTVACMVFKMFPLNQFNFEPKKLKAEKLITSHELTDLTSSNTVLCEPEFSMICGFLQKFAIPLDLINVPNFQNLMGWISNAENLPTDFQNFIIQLFQKAGRSMSRRKFLEDLSAYSATYSTEDAAIIKNIGFHALSIQQKLRLLKELLESLLITHPGLISYIDRQTPSELRSQQLGRDRYFQHYWLRQNILGVWCIYMGKGALLHAKPVASKRKQILELLTKLKSSGMSGSGIDNEENSSTSPTLLTSDEQQLIIFLTALSETLFVT